MYYFFKNNAHKKAFVKALKEVENEGYYINQASDDDVVFTTNMSKAVASLSGEKAQKEVAQGKPLDIEEYNPNLDTKRKVPADPKVLEAVEYTKQSNNFLRDRLFGGDSTFLDGENSEEKQFLSGESDLDIGELLLKDDETNDKIEQLEAEDRRRKIDEERLRKLHEYNERKLKMLEERKRQKEIEEQKQLLVEVVADKPETEEVYEEKPASEQEPETIVKAEPVVKPVVSPKPKRKRKKVVLKRKKKKYDADIIGGIDY